MNLKNLRKNAGYTQQEIAKRCNITVRSYQNYESGTREMGYKTLVTIANCFNCSVDYLLGHETKGIIHLDSYTPLQQEAISKLQYLNDDQLTMLNNYIDVMRGASLTELLENANKK